MMDLIIMILPAVDKVLAAKDSNLPLILSTTSWENDPHSFGGQRYSQVLKLIMCP